MLTVVEKVLLLQELELFRFAYSEHLAQLASISKEVRVEKETILFREEEPCKALHLLMSGSVCLELRNSVDHVLDRGALDYWSFFSETPHLFTARSLEESVLLTVSFEDLVDLMTAEPEFCWAIAKHIARRGRKEKSKRLRLTENKASNS